MVRYLAKYIFEYLKVFLHLVVIPLFLFFNLGEGVSAFIVANLYMTLAYFIYVFILEKHEGLVTLICIVYLFNLLMFL